TPMVPFPDNCDDRDMNAVDDSNKNEALGDQTSQQTDNQTGQQNAPGNDSPHGQTIPPNHEVNFFDWLRGLGFQREPGWLGGVASGIATRIGIDVMLVRGILVVLAILGFPVLFLYAVVWLLAPDSTGRIHCEQLGRG